MSGDEQMQEQEDFEESDGFDEVHSICCCHVVPHVSLDRQMIDAATLTMPRVHARAHLAHNLLGTADCITSMLPCVCSTLSPYCCLLSLDGVELFALGTVLMLERTQDITAMTALSGFC